MLKIQLANKVRWAFQKKEELKVKILILVGGRASTKSTGAADVVLSYIQAGQRWCLAREFLNSIEDSCQALMAEEIDRIGFEGFTVNARDISHASGGTGFHKGLNRNPASIKSIVADGIWIEEGEKLSEQTLSVLSASFRISAAKKERARRQGVDAKVPDVIITMNRGNSKDPISKEYLKDAEKDIRKKGWYADEDMLIVEVNYTDIPRDWFLSSGLEPERKRDERLMSQAEYDHKWNGAYNDTVENAIILPDWFDACVDAHEKVSHLGDFFAGQEKVTFDPSDVGEDPEALAHLRGNVIVEAMHSDVKDIEEACTWACSYANEKKVDAFSWDCDGMGIGLKFQVSQAFKGRQIEVQQFKGSEGPLNPDSVYMPVDEEQSKPKTNKDTFSNQRAQFYIDLANAMFKTYLAVTKGRYYPVDELISISSKVKHKAELRAELCSIPRKYIASAKILLMTKKEMLDKGITSPNIADCVMMSRKPVIKKTKTTKLKPMRWGQ